MGNCYMRLALVIFITTLVEFLSQESHLQDHITRCFDGQGVHLCFGLEMMLFCGGFGVMMVASKCGMRCSNVSKVV
jgi:hypothetical protein